MASGLAEGIELRKSITVPPPPASTASAIRTIPVVQPIAGIRFWSKLAASAGPGYLIAVGYMDPGNWATDIAGGSGFGFALLPIIFISNFAAMFLQWMALRLGIATGRDLAELCREQYSRRTAQTLWVTCEVAIIACDLAEVIGTAIALKLLFHLPLVLGAVLTAFDTFVILALERFGFRKIEAFVIALVALIAASFAYELWACHPPLGAMLASFVPGPATPVSTAAVYLALGIFGATVMPHNLYLHSAMAKKRPADISDGGKRETIRFSTIDMIGALTIALFINAAILVTAASAFHWSGHSGVETIEDAYKLLSPALGAGAASVVFAVALLAAGQNSTLTGTMAGQVVMEGFLGLKMSACRQRLLTRGTALVPAVLVAAIAGDRAVGQLLILSQVILSLQLGFAVVPLVRFTSDKNLMGGFVNGTRVRLGSYALAGAIIAANTWLIVEAVF